MGQEHAPLSERSLTILKMIAAGRSYDQILLHYPDLGYQDIFDAAQEALTRLESPERQPDRPAVTGDERVAPDAPIRAEFGHAQVPSRQRRPAPSPHAPTSPVDPAAPWTSDEDTQLERLYRRGAHLAEIGQALGRHHGAIRERLAALGLNSDRDDDILSFPDGLESSPGASSVLPRLSAPPWSSAGWDAIRRRLEGRPETD